MPSVLDTALGRYPRRRAQFFPIRTSRLVNNIYFFCINGSLKSDAFHYAKNSENLVGNQKEWFSSTKKIPEKGAFLKEVHTLTNQTSQSEIYCSILTNRFVALLLFSRFSLIWGLRKVIIENDECFLFLWKN